MVIRSRGPIHWKGYPRGPESKEGHHLAKVAVEQHRYVLASAMKLVSASNILEIHPRSPLDRICGVSARDEPDGVRAASTVMAVGSISDRMSGARF